MKRKRLPPTRDSITRRLGIVGHEPLYVTVGGFENGQPRELFLFGQQGTERHGLLDALAVCVSIGLQYGVPLNEYTKKLTGMRFEPMGFTGDKDFPQVSSYLDYLARWLDVKYGERQTDT